MQAAIVIPWRGGQADRERHYTVVRAAMRATLPDAPLLNADSGHHPFSRAGSRNHGVRLAQTAAAADVVAIVDADTIPEPAPLHDALRAAHGDGRLHLPYTHYRGLSQHGTRDYLAGSMPDECDVELAHEWATGGVMVIRPDAWWRAGGMDERFVGFGHEDVAFRIAADTLLGPTARHPGVITHLWHPKAMGLGSPQHQANGQLCERYNAANGDPDAIQALIAERQATPCSSPPGR